MVHTPAFRRTCVALMINQIFSAQGAMLTVDSNADDGTGCTLREAIQSVNDGASQSGCIGSGAFGNDTITFATPTLLGQTITLTGGPLSIDSGVNLTVQGLGQDLLAIDGNNSGRVLEVSFVQSLLLNDLTITGGSSAFGGGISFSGSNNLQINDCTITGNHSDSTGGGVGISGIGNSLVVTNSLISGNTAASGGGFGLFGRIDDNYGPTLILSNSEVTMNTASSRGGGILVGLYSVLRTYGSQIGGNFATVGGGVYLDYESRARLEDSTISGNNADYGGGISNTDYSRLVIYNSSIAGNSAAMHGGGFHAAIGSRLSVESSSITGNSAQEGGGLFANSNSRTYLDNSTISNNSAGTYGGGINVKDTGRVSLTDSTTSSNSAGSRGGGINAANSGSASLTNSTVSNNSAVYGGGISSFNSGSVSLTNGTVSSNSANYGGGILVITSSTVDLINTIVSGNAATVVGDELSGDGTFGGEIVVNHHNLLGHAAIAFSDAFTNFAAGATDIVATMDAGAVGIHQPTSLPLILDPLADNGCREKAGVFSGAACVRTHALAPDSPAINAGDPAACTSSDIVFDQRGQTRDGLCDIGAYEFIEEMCFVIRGSGSATMVFCL